MGKKEDMMRHCLLTFLAVFMAGSHLLLGADKNTVSLHLYDIPQNANGFMTGVNPKTIRVVSGGAILPRGAIRITKIADPKDKADPGSEHDEFIVSFAPAAQALSHVRDEYVFSKDYGGNLTVHRLIKEKDSSRNCKWQAVTGSDAETLHQRLFGHLKARLQRDGQPTPLVLRGDRGGLLVKDGKVMCGFGEGSWQLHEVVGSRLAELRKLGLESVHDVEAQLWGVVDTQKSTIDLHDYKITRIQPK